MLLLQTFLHLVIDVLASHIYYVFIMPPFRAGLTDYSLLRTVQTRSLCIFSTRFRVWGKKTWKTYCACTIENTRKNPIQIHQVIPSLTYVLTRIYLYCILLNDQAMNRQYDLANFSNFSICYEY